MKPRSAERLAASLAHHIRSPLATALLYMHLIDELGSGIDQELRDGLANARDEMLRVNRLLGNLVDYHSLGRLVVVPALIDAGPVAAEAMAKTLIATPADVALELSGEDLVDWWDRSALQEIVHNLLSNAIRHRRPPISMRVARSGRNLVITVRDGGGMSSRELSRMFRQRLTVPGDRTGKMDLGMWLTGQLAAAHGGAATAEVDRNGGTTVTVTLVPGPRQTL
jgi:two-component system, OmpR family, sensor histidine kinase MtrB